jgi:ribosome recycling factor
MEDILLEMQGSFDKAIDHMKHMYSSLRLGSAQSALVENIIVESYGDKQPLKNVASIHVLNASTLNIEPWDKSLLSGIYEILSKSDLGLPVVNNGTMLIINIPPLTEERRKDLVKVIHTYAEEARISIRTVRGHALHQVKAKKESKEISEDLFHNTSDDIENKTKAQNTLIKDLLQQKEAAIMKI